MTIYNWSLFALFILVAGISTTLTIIIGVKAGIVSVMLGLVGCWLYHALLNDFFE